MRFLIQKLHLDVKSTVLKFLIGQTKSCRIIDGKQGYEASELHTKCFFNCASNVLQV